MRPRVRADRSPGQRDTIDSILSIAREYVGRLPPPDRRTSRGLCGWNPKTGGPEPPPDPTMPTAGRYLPIGLMASRVSRRRAAAILLWFEAAVTCPAKGTPDADSGCAGAGPAMAVQFLRERGTDAV